MCVLFGQRLEKVGENIPGEEVCPELVFIGGGKSLFNVGRLTLDDSMNKEETFFRALLLG